MLIQKYNKKVLIRILSNSYAKLILVKNNNKKNNSPRMASAMFAIANQRSPLLEVGVAVRVTSRLGLRTRVMMAAG